MIRKFAISLTVLFMVANGIDSSHAECTSKCMTWDQGGPKLQGSGKVVTEQRRVDKFNAISVVSGGSVEIERTGAPGVSVSADDNLQSLFLTEVKGGTLYLSIARGKSFYGSNPVFRITVADLRSIEITGAGDVSANKLAEERLALSILGSGSVRLAGSANELTLDITGSGDIGARTLAAKRARVSISGSGSVELTVSDSLDVNISGAGDVSYSGSPKITQRISGAGSVSRN
jgi:hypothetical protein